MSPAADIALPIVQHHHAVGFRHRAQDARALRAGDATFGMPSSPCIRMPRWYSVRPGFFRIAPAERARSRGRDVGAHHAQQGFAREEVERTITATGLPGRPNRKALWPFEAMRPKASGRPGRMPIFQKVTSPRRAMSCLMYRPRRPRRRPR